MILKDITLKTPQENILYDEVLLYLAKKADTGEILRFWESSEDFVVLGRISKEEEDIKVDAVCREEIPVLRRSSGGGTVVQGKGCLNFTLILSKERDPRLADLRRSYETILGKVIAALQTLGIESMFVPISDIALIDSHKKVSGNAQKRSKKFILHHGTILYDFDLNKIERYLKMPTVVPEYRQGRMHLDFVANVPARVEDVKKALRKTFGADGPGKQYCLSDEERSRLDELLNSRAAQVDLCVNS